MEINLFFSTPIYSILQQLNSDIIIPSLKQPEIGFVPE
jgi:hypothetical protein